MKILIDIGDDYAVALKMMASRMHKRSRQELIVHVLMKIVDDNPSLLEEVHQAFPQTLGPNIKLLSPLEPIKESLYLFTRHDDSQVQGWGQSPGEALSKIFGKTVSTEEYNKEFKDRRIIREAPSI